MKTFIVYQSPEFTQLESDTKLLRDGIAIIALIVPVLWLIYHRLWWALLVYAMILSGFALLGSTFLSILVLPLSALPALYLFLEGDRLVQQKWERKGWIAADVVNANNLEEAEMRYFNEYVEKPVAPLQYAANGAQKKAPSSPTQIGLFPLDNTA